MKNFTIHTIFAAAALFGASAAHAETLLRAEVPFAFSMNGAKFGPGSYEIRASNTPAQLVLCNLENYRMSVALYIPEEFPRQAQDGKSKLVFDCLDGACVLVDVWDSGSGLDLRLPSPKNRKGIRTQTEETPATVVRVR
jgi:hypothetical protein